MLSELRTTRSLAKGSEGESKHPGNVSRTMPIQGVLLNELSPAFKVFS
jgi:hypothetical protein